MLSQSTALRKKWEPTPDSLITSTNSLVPRNPTVIYIPNEFRVQESPVEFLSVTCSLFLSLLHPVDKRPTQCKYFG